MVLLNCHVFISMYEQISANQKANKEEKIIFKELSVKDAHGHVQGPNPGSQHSGCRCSPLSQKATGAGLLEATQMCLFSPS